MKDFNLFEPLLEEATRYGQHLFCLGKKGDETTMMSDVSKWYVNEQRTNGYILIYDKSTGSLDWKAIYKNTKGIFFKKNGSHYIKN